MPAAGSLERVIDLHHRGQLTNKGKPPALEELEKEETARAAAARLDARPKAPPGAPVAGHGAKGSAGGSGEDSCSDEGLFKDAEAGSAPPPAVLRLTGEAWTGGVRAQDIIFSYRSVLHRVLGCGAGSAVL